MTRAASRQNPDPHPAREDRGDPRRRARRLLHPRLPRRHPRPDRRGGRHVEAEPALLFRLQGGHPPDAARAPARHLARAAAPARPRRRPGRARSAPTSAASSRWPATIRARAGSSPARSCRARRTSPTCSAGPLKELVDAKAAGHRRLGGGGAHRPGRPAPPDRLDLGGHPALRRLRRPARRRARPRPRPPLRATPSASSPASSPAASRPDRDRVKRAVVTRCRAI